MRDQNIIYTYVFQDFFYKISLFIMYRLAFDLKRLVFVSLDHFFYETQRYSKVSFVFPHTTKSNGFFDNFETFEDWVGNQYEHSCGWGGEGQALAIIIRSIQWAGHAFIRATICLNSNIQNKVKYIIHLTNQVRGLWYANTIFSNCLVIYHTFP